MTDNNYVSARAAMRSVICFLTLMSWSCQAWMSCKSCRVYSRGPLAKLHHGSILFALTTAGQEASPLKGTRPTSVLFNNKTQVAADNSISTLSGYITAVRGFGKSFCFVDITNHDGETVQTMLKRQDYQGSFFDATRKAMLPGVKIRVEGTIETSRNQEETLLVRNANLIGWPRNPQHVKILLESMLQGELQAELTLPLHVDDHLRFNSSHSTYMLAKQIVNGLPDDEDYPYEMLATLNAGDYVLPVAPRDIQRGVLVLPASTVSIRASVGSRRRYQGNITQLELVDETTRNRYLCILHPSICSSANSNILGNLLAPTSHVNVSGHVIDPQEGSGDATTKTQRIWAADSQILRAPWQPNTVMYLLQVARQGGISCTQAAQALGITVVELEDIMRLPTETERQWKAAELSQSIQGMSRAGKTVNDSLLDCFRNLLTLYPRESVGKPPSRGKHANQDVSDDGSRWRRKKEPQLEWMLHQVEHVVRQHPHYQQRPIRILDIGGGKGLLANYLATNMLGKIEVQVVDIADRAIKNGAMRSRRLNLPVQYTVGDASQVAISGPVDVVVALHACGSLTDVALGHATMNHASFVFCPCCFCSHAHLRVPSVNGGGQAQSMDVHDWLGIDEHQFGELKKVAEIQGDLQTANQAIHAICAIRAAAAKRYSHDLEVSVKTFPIAYSTRNFCLVGIQRQQQSAMSSLKAS